MAKSRVVGLDIGTTHVRAAELEFSGGGPRSGQATLVQFGQLALPPGAVRDGEVAEPSTVASALQQLWNQSKFSTRAVNLGVGNQRIVVRELELPWLPMSQLRASLPFQVSELLPMSTDQALLDFYPTSEFDGPNGRMVGGMLVAASRDTVNSNVLAASAAGLKVQMVDLSAFALLRALARGELAHRTVALVDIGARVTTVVIAAQGVPRFIRSLASGGQDLTDSIASSLSVSGPEAEQLKRELVIGATVSPELQAAAESVRNLTQTLVESIRNTFVYYASNNPRAGIELAVLTGGGTRLPGLGQYLSSASRLPVTFGDPLAGVKLGRAVTKAQLAGSESLVAMAIGLGYGVPV